MLNEVANTQKRELDEICTKEVQDRSQAGVYLTTQIAKELGISAMTLNQKLAEAGIQYKRRKQWLLKSKYQKQGYTRTETYFYSTRNGQKSRMQTVWTEKGRGLIKEVVR